MNTYIIICALGTRKGTVQADTRADAIKLYIGDDDYERDSFLRSLLIAVRKEDFKTFQKQINKI